MFNTLGIYAKSLVHVAVVQVAWEASVFLLFFLLFFRVCVCIVHVRIGGEGETAGAWTNACL